MNKDVERIISEKYSLIDKEIAKVFPKETIPNLHNAVWYHLNTGGKRIRPALAIITCEALGGDTKKVLPFAAACEILHQWLLIHDDIEDKDKIRRNKETVWAKYGLAHGINIGDYMSHKVFELILNSKNYGVDEKKILKLVDIIVNTAIRTAEGQSMDINLRNSSNPTEKEYMEMVKAKTSYYLTVPMVGGAIIADADEKIIKKILEYGEKIGPAFQISDDLLDLTSGKGRKEVGRDIKEGKKSILTIHCLQKCGRDGRKKLLSILNKDPARTTKDEVDYVKKLFEKYGSISYAKSKAKRLAEEAKEEVKDMPHELKELLDYFADYLVEREK
jgi:geranylgeranyl pyrophosphate synthase